MAFADDDSAVRLNGNSNFCDVHGCKGATILPRQDATGFNSFTAPTIETKNAVGLRNCVPSLDVQKSAAMGLPSADLPTVEVALERYELFCREAHHLTLTLRTGSGLERETPSISTPVLSSLSSSWRLSRGVPGCQ